MPVKCIIFDFTGPVKSASKTPEIRRALIWTSYLGYHSAQKLDLKIREGVVLYLQHEIEYLESIALSLAHLGHVEVQHTQRRNLHLLTLLILKTETSLYILHFSLRV